MEARAGAGYVKVYVILKLIYMFEILYPAWNAIARVSMHRNKRYCSYGIPTLIVKVNTGSC